MASERPGATEMAALLSSLPRRLAAYLLPWSPALVLLNGARWQHPNGDEVWLHAFRWAAPVALAYFAFAAWSRLPMKRLPMGVNLYVAIGGAMAWLGWMPGLLALARWRETAVFACIVLVALLAATGSRHGLVAQPGLAGPARRRIDALLLAAIALGLCWSWLLRGDPLLAAVLPITLVSLLASELVRRATALPRFDPALEKP